MFRPSEGRTLLSISGDWVVVAHTIGAIGAFLVALVVGSSLHFRKIVKNEWFGYPDEWFPSVSATIGDHYPERSLFQLIMAVTAPPRFLLVILLYFVNRRQTSFWPGAITFVGLCRTITAGGWIYITSTDAHDWHDVFMISYLVLTAPWMFGNIFLAQKNSITRKYRKRVVTCFFSTIPPLIYYFIQHKVHRVPGAYTKYSFFEWSIIFSDVFFDAVSFFEFQRLELKLVERPDYTSGIYVAPLAPSPNEYFYTYSSKQADDDKPAVIHEFLPGRGRDWLIFISDSFLAFTFWTTLTALGPTVWHFSVWGMGIAGQEAFVLATLSPFLLSVPIIRKFSIKHYGFLQFFSLIGIACFNFSKPLLRLEGVALGIALGCLSYAARWTAMSKRPEIVERHAFAFGTGIVLSNVAKFACYSLNPAWPIMNDKNGGHNKICLILAVICSIETCFRPKLPPSLATSTQQRPSHNNSSATPNPITIGIGFGALLFILHTFFSDSGTIIAWVWDGYPIQGPVAVPNATLVITAISGGLFISSMEEIVCHPIWYFIAWGAVSILHANKNWTGFCGGLLFGLCVFSILPRFIRTATSVRQPGLTFGMAWLTYTLLLLAGVWTVAYAFVPGGVYLRERTDLVILVTMVLFGLGFYHAYKLEPISKMIQAQYRPLLERSRNLTKTGLAALVVISILTATGRIRNAVKPSPHYGDQRLITAGIWTVHFAMDNMMWDSQRRMADLFSDLELDVVGLLESDLQRIVMGNRDLTQYASETLGYYADIGPGPNQHTWGAALLSKYPIVNSTHHLLPSPAGELAPAIHATLNVSDTLVDVIVAHNGQEEDPLDRQLQSQHLGEIMNATFPRPFIFLGYVVTKPKQAKPAPYNYLVQDGKMIDVDESDWDRWCEYILFRGLERIGYARITRGGHARLPAITDTEMQVAKFIVPEQPIDPTINVRPNRASESNISLPGWKFPSIFNGKGIRGHRFHVLDGGKPRYYNQ